MPPGLHVVGPWTLGIFSKTHPLTVRVPGGELLLNNLTSFLIQLPEALVPLHSVPLNTVDSIVLASIPLDQGREYIAAQDDNANNLRALRG